MKRSTLTELVRALHAAHPDGGFDGVINDLRFVAPEAMWRHSARVGATIAKLGAPGQRAALRTLEAHGYERWAAKLREHGVGIDH